MEICLGEDRKIIVEKGENAYDQHFLLFPQCFHSACCLRVVKSKDCVVKIQCISPQCNVPIK